MADGQAGPHVGGARFVAQSTIADSDAVGRAIRRMAHEIIERNEGLDDVVVIGLEAGGVPVAHALARALADIEGTDVPTGSLDVTFYRDDIDLRPVLPDAVSRIDFDLTSTVVVLVDDVVFTGRTIRAALDAVMDRGRPRAVQLAVLVDRGHRELPIRPDFVGKNLPTRRSERVSATTDGILLGTLELQGSSDNSDNSDSNSASDNTASGGGR